ncbi:flagellar hook-basal body complex protein [Planktomarina sp.]|nr:flagellar hook-basal body complex protein [Planktomarina sp.]MDB4841228.1 flagellar hook-basal body complex protein [Planktomarina sp.]
MSFYTALTGLKGAQTDISTTSNNIANVGSNGFKKSRAEFGDIFGSTPLQAKTVGVGTVTKSITQQFSQGNISASANTLDMAISGQGFFAMEAGGNSSQTVYTRNGAFNVDDNGFIVDSNGQFLLGYPVDSDGQVSDKTLAGSNKLKLDGSYGDPKQTSSITMGVNLDASSPVISKDTIFDSEDPDTYSSTSAVTIFDNGGNPQSATVFYIKRQNASDVEADPTFKYDTKLFVDGLEITPTLTRAVDPQEAELYIDKFGNQTTTPQDPAYLLGGKGYPLYKVDDLGPAVDSTPATLHGLPVDTYLADGKTIEIVTDPLKFASTQEYYDAINTVVPSSNTGTFWGKDFLLVDVDESGPISIDIPPGTYNGTQLAAAVEVAVREAAGDDRKVQLEPGVDNTFSLDLKQTTGDGKSEGLDAGPIEIDLHGGSYVASATEAEEGLDMDTFLVHAQLKLTEAMNTYIQGTGGTTADNLAGVNATQIDDLGADGRLFKKLKGTAIDATDIPTGNDIFEVTQKEGDSGDANYVAAGTKRHVAYSNTDGKPAVKAYDLKTTMDVSDTNRYGVATTGANAGRPYISVLKTEFDDAPETVRLYQFDGGNALLVKTEISDFFGTEDISVADIEEDENQALNYRVYLDFDMNGADFPTFDGTEMPVTVLGKPSDHIEAYFESTEGLVDGVEKAFYSGKIVVREIQQSAKREHADDTTDNQITALAFTGTLASANNVSTLGLVAGNSELSTNWVDERDPTVKIAYDENEQRLTFDASNTSLGLGTGVGMNTFTVYSPAMDSGTNSVGIPSFGSNVEVSLSTDDLFLGNSFINDGDELQVANKRYGIEVDFDTVNYNFSIKSGTTGEALAANSALGVTSNQSASNVSVGRLALDQFGDPVPTDDMAYAFHAIGQGENQILGYPRLGETSDFIPATGLSSKPAVAVGAEALVDMANAFSITDLANENKFNIVVDGVASFITVPEGNYNGTSLAQALEKRINLMQHPTTGNPIGGVKVTFDLGLNNLTFTSGTTGGSSTFKVAGAQRFGLLDIPLGIGETAQVRTPVQATDELGRPLWVSPTGEITAKNEDFADNLVKDFFPVFLDDGELTFSKTGELTSPITKVTYEGLPNSDMIVDYSSATSFSQPFSATDVGQDGFASGRLTNLEIDNYGNVNAGYSNGSNVTLGKIIIANFANNSGLKQIGNSTFSASAASGDPELGEAAEDGFGNILSGSLEKSNVDITEELVNLITAQRNYQAAAKAMETTTSMTQTIINIRL